MLTHSENYKIGERVKQGPACSPFHQGSDTKYFRLADHKTAINNT